MAVDQGGGVPHDGVVPVNEQLREIFGDATQTQVSEHLRAAGIKEASQSTVSAWLNGRVPTLEQLAQIEDAYNVRRGTVSTKAGYIDGGVIQARRKRRTTTRTPDDLASLVAEVREFLTLAKQRRSDIDDMLAEAREVSAAARDASEGMADLVLAVAEIRDFVRRREAALARRPGELEP